MPDRLLKLITVLLAMLLASTARGQLLGGRPLIGRGEIVTARGAVATLPLVPGTENQVIVELTIAPGYHAQSAFAAAPNIPAHLTVQNLPPGVTAGDIQAQAGLDIPTPPALGTGTLSVYEGQAYFVVPLKVAADAPPGEASIELSMQTQACNDTSCDPPKTARLEIAARIGPPGQTPAPPDPLLALAQGKTLLPQPTGTAAAGRPPATGASNPAPTAATPQSGPGTMVALASTDAQLALLAQRDYRALNAGDDQHSLAYLLFFALVGGLILNVMPCVLPVIPLKALSFVQQAHGSRRMALAHGAVFSAGIITLFVALGMLLRIAGMFYGQQFQSTPFLVAMVMFVVALSLSMLGVWTIQPPRAVYAADDQWSRRTGWAGTFSSGLMATLLATPCSAPFLGPVFAWALVQPAVVTGLMLGLVGLGMSLPYLVLAAFPAALAWLPRSGRWSELLKQGLGIVMLGVAIYLVTLVPSTRLWPWVLAGAVIVALVCWAWGQIPSVLMPPGRIWAIRAVAVVIGAGLGVGACYAGGTLSRTEPPPPSVGQIFLPDRTSSGAVWLPFNTALLDRALQEGRPVMVDWTADWCINCRGLEAFVLSKEELQQAVVDRNVVLLRADLSEDNPPATALNAKLGGASIPVLAIFSPARPEQPVVLRDGYSTARVIAELRAAR